MHYKNLSCAQVQNTECLPGRTDVQCLHRWQKVIDPKLVKGPWSKKEDDLLIELVGKHGYRWAEIAEHLPGRIGKQCRERWCNHLDPDISKAAWTQEEERILINAHGEYGNRWSEIAKSLPGRTENSVKNHWNCSLKKKLDKYLARGSALNHPGYTIPALHGNKTETGRNPVEGKRNLSTKRLPKGRNCNGDSCCLDLVLGHSGYSSSHLPSSENGNSIFHPNGTVNNPMRPSSSTYSLIELVRDDLSKNMNLATEQPKVLDDILFEENGSPPGTHVHSNIPSLISSPPPETSSKYLPPYLNSTPHVSCDDWSYTGLCYEPPDQNIFLSTGRFPSTDSYIRQPNRSISVSPSKSRMTASSDSKSSPISILRSAAMSYDNMPSIITKRTIQTSQEDVCIPYKLPKVDDDRFQTSRQPVLFSSEHQKLDKFEAIKSVGKCLEQEFSEA